MNATLQAGAFQRPIGRLAAGMSLFAMSLVLVTSASAGIIHDESVNGDLSDDPFNPTEFTLSIGLNSIMATSVSGDREYVALTIPAGLQLSQVILVSYVGDDGTAFIAVQAGDVFTEPAMDTDPANLLGWTHFGPGEGNVGANILPAIGMGPGSIGFTPPLAEGTYTFWMQQTGDLSTTYQFDFLVTPAPGAAALLGLAGFVGPRRRRRSRKPLAIPRDSFFVPGR